MKIIYTKPDGGVNIVIAAPKDQIERDLGRALTQEEFQDFIIDKAIPTGSLNIRMLEDADIPADREFRDAWVDTAPDNKVNVDVAKAKDVKLEELRTRRNVVLAQTDIEFTRAMEEGDMVKIASLKAKRAALRNATEPLKAFEAVGVDDEQALDTIRQLAILTIR